MQTVEENTKRFEELLASVDRAGIDKLLGYIRNKTDFYKAPASTRFHLACEGGLLQHSLNVYDCLVAKKESPIWKPILSVSAPPNYLVSLISRVMKADGYIKNELTPEEVDVLRQMQATLSIEGLFLTETEVMDIASMIRGEISREAYQQRLKENYRRYGKR